MGDNHGLATALVADPLRGRGFSITDLGANTPAASWANTIAGTQRIVGVGVVVSTHVDDALIAATIATIKANHDRPVVLGGVAIRDQAHALAEQRLGDRALSLFDGSALGVTPSRTASRAASTTA